MENETFNGDGFSASQARYRSITLSFCFAFLAIANTTDLNTWVGRDNMENVEYSFLSKETKLQGSETKPQTIPTPWSADWKSRSKVQHANHYTILPPHFQVVTRDCDPLIFV